MHPLKSRLAAPGAGVYAVCSANRQVLESSMRHAARHGYPLLAEATANQVDQAGGYTGMTPARFAAWAAGLAREAGLPPHRLVLGGDHLGPLTWRRLPEAEAMARAEVLVAAYAAAGFAKLHLDTSMHLGGDDPARPLTPAVCARRAAALARAAYGALQAIDAPPPLLVLGSEVPAPGGAAAGEHGLAVTEPQAFRAQVAAFRRAFEAEGLPWADVAAFVVQPGVEFGDDFVNVYDPRGAEGLRAALEDFPGLVFEGHSTDYQPPEALARLVADRVAILKVGPALTFALRRGLAELEELEAAALPPGPGRSHFRAALLAAMRADDGHWRGHYGPAEPADAALLGGLSDRCRYYLPQPAVAEALARLLESTAALGLCPAAVIDRAIHPVLDGYAAACGYL